MHRTNGVGRTDQVVTLEKGVARTVFVEQYASVKFAGDCTVMC